MSESIKIGENNMTVGKKSPKPSGEFKVEINGKDLKLDTIVVSNSTGRIRIAICDDNAEDLSVIKTGVEIYCAKKREYDFQIFTFSDSSALMHYIKKNGGFDILLLDIYMPMKNGTKVAEELRENNDHCEIIFISTSEDHTREAYKVNAIQYMKKPVTEDDLGHALDRAVAQLGSIPSLMILLKTTEGMRRINASEIIYSEPQSHYQRISLSDGKIYSVRMTVGELFEVLSSAEKFMKIGSAYIVSVRNIISIDVKKITLKNGAKIPMLRNTYKKIRQEYLDLLFEEI